MSAFDPDPPSGVVAVLFALIAGVVIAGGLIAVAVGFGVFAGLLL